MDIDEASTVDTSMEMDIDEKDGMAFYDWVDQVYNPAALTAQFQAQGWAVRLTDTILRRE